MTPLDFHFMGLSIIPIGYRDKSPNIRYLPNQKWRQYQDKNPCISEVEKWLDDPWCNYAVITGWQNLVIVDFDNLDWHDVWLNCYGVNGYADTYTVETGRGYHYYYFIEDKPDVTLGWAGGEIKATGYCLIPPSIHPSGTLYKALNPDNEIMTIGSIYDILPKDVFNGFDGTYNRKSAFDSVWTPKADYQNDVKQSWRILHHFSHARPSGDNWYMVRCPFHDDKKASAWVNDNDNRFGCHGCINGSMSSIDFYMKLNGCDYETAVKEML